VDLQTTVVGAPWWELTFLSGLGLRLDHEVCAAYPRTGARIELVEPGWLLRGQPYQSLT
jgi:hypothetical protein